MLKSKQKTLALVALIAILPIMTGCEDSGTPSEQHAQDERNDRLHNQKSEQIAQSSIDKLDALKGCIISVVSGQWNQQLNIVRCPNSTTSITYKNGKKQQTVVTGE